MEKKFTVRKPKAKAGAVLVSEETRGDLSIQLFQWPDGQYEAAVANQRTGEGCAALGDTPKEAITLALEDDGEISASDLEDGTDDDWH